MKTTEKLLAVSKLNEYLIESSGLDKTALDLVMDTAKKVTSSDRSSLFIYNSDEDILESEVAQGLLTKICVKRGEGIVGQCALLKESIVEQDVDATKHFNAEVDLGSGYVTRNTMTVPVLDTEGTLLGVIQVLNKVSGDYDESDEELLYTIAKSVSQRLHRVSGS